MKIALPKGLLKQVYRGLLQKTPSEIKDIRLPLPCSFSTLLADKLVSKQLE